MTDPLPAMFLLFIYLSHSLFPPSLFSSRLLRRTFTWQLIKLREEVSAVLRSGFGSVIPPDLSFIFQLWMDKKDADLSLNCLLFELKMTHFLCFVLSN